MSFFKNIFNPAVKPDTEVKQRAWPREYTGANAPASPEQFLQRGLVYSRVFQLVNTEDKQLYNRRYVYMSARQVVSYGGRNIWTIETQSFDNEDIATLKSRGSKDRDDGDYALLEIVDFEKNMIRNGNIPVPGTTENFRLFASTIGKYVNDKNEIVKIDPALPQRENLTLPRRVADQFYAMTGAIKEPLSTWAGFYNRYIAFIYTSEKEAPIKELRENPQYKMNVEQLLDAMAGFRFTPDMLGVDAGRVMRDVRQAAYATRSDDELFNWLIDTTKVVGLLRAGAAVIEHVPDMVEGRVNLNKISYLRELRDQMNAILDLHLGLAPEECRQIGDIMLKGQDPFGPDLPIETFFKKYPPLPPVKKPKAPKQIPPPPPPPVPPKTRTIVH